MAFVGIHIASAPAGATPDLGWGTPQTLAQHKQGDAWGTDTAAGPMGIVFAVWQQYNGVQTNVWGNVYIPGGGILGQGWAEAVKLNFGPNGAYDPQVAADFAGNAIAVWEEWNSAKGYTLYANRYDATRGWTGAVAIDDPTYSYSYFGSVAMTPGGDAFVAWQQWDGTYYSIFGATFSLAGGWTSARLLDTQAGIAQIPIAAADPAGNAMVVWDEYDGTRWNVVAIRYLAGTGWLAPVIIETNALDSRAPQVVLDGAGNGLAAWIQFDGARWNLYGNRFTPGGGWGAIPVALEASTNGVYAAYWSFSLAVNGAGDGSAVWSQHDGAYYSIYGNRFSGGAWAAVATLTEGIANNCYYPEVGQDAAGNAVAAFYCSDPTGYTDVYAIRHAGGWGFLALIDNGNHQKADFPSVAVDMGGVAIAVWPQDTDPSTDVRWSILALRFNGASWGNPFLGPRLEWDDRGNIDPPFLAVSERGYAVAAWNQYDGITTNVYASLYTPGVGWGPATRLENDDLGLTWDVWTAIDANGNAIVSWRQWDSVDGAWGIFANVYQQGVGWTGAVTLDPYTTYAANPLCAMDPFGNAVVVFSQWDPSGFHSQYARRWTNGLWQPVDLLEPSNEYAEFFGIDADANGRFLVAWQQYDGAQYSIYASLWDGNVWTPATLAENRPNYVGGPIIVRMNDAGTGFVGWPEWNAGQWDSWTNEFNPTTGWGTEHQLESGPGDSGFLTVQPDDAGNAIASWYVWNEAIGEWEINAAYYAPGMGWSSSIGLSGWGGDAQYPDIAVDHRGNWILGWREFDGTTWGVVSQRYNSQTGWEAPHVLRMGTDFSDAMRLGTDGAGNIFALWRETLNGISAPVTNRYVIGDGLPSLLVTDPSPGLRTNPSVTVSGFTDPGVFLTVDGLPVTVRQDGSFSTGVVLPEGPHTFVIVAQDAAGGMRFVTVDVEVDTVAPAVSITSPTPGFLTNNPALTVTGTTEVGATLTVNGINAAVGPTGGFSLPLTLAEGGNTITAIARDAAGNTRTTSVGVTLDTIVPALAVYTPMNQVTNNPAVVVSGQTEVGASVTVDGSPVTVGPSGAFSTTVTLPEGSHTFNVVARDAAGNTAASAASVVVDMTAPNLAITAPANGLLTTSSVVTVQGTADPTAQIVVNGIVANNVAGSFSLSLALREGVNLIRVDATDPAGNAATASVSVTLDTTPPIIFVTAPADGALTNDPVVIVSGFTDPGTAVTIDGSPVVVGGTGLFSYSVTLPDGPHTFDVVAADAAGNEAGAAVTITVDTQPPVISITSPATGTTTASPTVTVSGQAETGAAVTVNGYALTPSPTGAWSVTLVLRPGSNVVTATATDAAGNSATAQISVTFVDPVPGLRQQLNDTLDELRNTRDELNETNQQLQDTNDALNDTRTDLGAARQTLASLGTEVLLLLLLAIVALAIGALQFLQLGKLRKRIEERDPRKPEAPPPS
ncbi:MAG TPA: Ig-like domain-containing protein [Thermoplasmata archaeon]|nr:Ig-like domain-containing protein [Thermoplasmata archaeon]